jgi:hypothetical protein
MKRFLVAILIALSACAAGSGGDTGALTLRDYQAELDRWSAKIVRLKKNPRQAAQLRHDLPPSWVVEDGGQRWESPTAWLDAELATIEQDGQTAPTQVAAMQAHLGALRTTAAQTARVDDPVSRRKMGEILARPEFHPQQRSWFDDLRRKVNKWLDPVYKQIERFFDWFFRRARMPRMPDVSFPFLQILTAALLLAAIFFLSRRFLFRPDRGIAPAPETMQESRRAWLDFSRRAAQAEEAGDHREAIRLAYWAGIYRLEELGVWRAESTRTHREYLRLLPREAAQRGPLTAITRSFELSWYGGLPASADEFHDVTNHLEEMGCQLPSNPATATS